MMRVVNVVLSSVPERQREAEVLAEHLELSFRTELEKDTDYVLMLTGERLELHKPGSRMTPLYIDFSSRKAKARLRQHSPEPLRRAIGIKGAYYPQVLDATAGLGQDAFVLAAAGCRVEMLERSPIIWALLQDALVRARIDPELKLISERMSLRLADASHVLAAQDAPAPDVIYLDPMYPASSKRAAKRKSMQFFRDLVGGDQDAEGLLELARGRATKRVVVKRPVKAAALAAGPSYRYDGKTTRFDIYLS